MYYNVYSPNIPYQGNRYITKYKLKEKVITMVEN